MNVAEARQRIETLIKTLEDCGYLGAAHDLAEVLPLLRKRPPAKFARVRSRRITSDVVREVLRFSTQHPDVPNRDIGRRFGIDGGRVSEILQGDRRP